MKKLLLIVFLLIPFSCIERIYVNKYHTKNVIIVVVDGARYSETWGDSTHKNIPQMANKLSGNGIINTNFYNNGITYTVPGHIALTTGFYQNIDNGGAELPQYPSIFQFWLQANEDIKSLAWVIASKDKLEVLSNCCEPDWKDRYTPLDNCGTDGKGVGSGYRDDSLTLTKTFEILTEHHPQLVLINFKEPDYSGHYKSWDDYLQGIRDTDEYTARLWDFLEKDLFYRGRTTLFITNDHGRHLDGVADGYRSHGDGCEGCRHLIFFAAGPDFRQDTIIDTKRELIDIPATISELMHFDDPYIRGKVMFELFK